MIPEDIALLATPGTSAVSPDGTLAVVAVTQPDLAADEEVGHLWLVPTDGSAPPRPLTRGHRDTSPAWSPDGRWVAFVRAEPKGKPQLHVVEATGGEPVVLTDAPLGAGDPRWSPDSRRLVYVARVPEAGRYVPDGDPSAEAPRLITTFQYRADNLGFSYDRPRHLFVVDLPASLLERGERPAALPASRRLTDGAGDAHAPCWLPDGRHVVAVAAVHPNHDEDLRADAVVVDADAAEPAAPRPLTDAAAGSTLGVETAVPSADGGALWLVAGDLGPSGRGFVATQNALYRLDLTTGAGGPAAVGTPARLTDPETSDLVPGLVLPVGDEVLVADQVRGAVVLIAVPAAGGEPRVLVDAPRVVLGAAEAAGTAVVSAADPASAGEVLAVRVADGATTVLTDLAAPLRATGRLRLPAELTATAPDGYPVHGWVTLPDPARHGDGPYPTVLMIHGGPFAQYTHAVFDEVQTLAHAGYAVVHGNPRGSGGYGAAHGRAIQGAFGTVDTDDVLALLDHALATTPALDATRVGVMGGSYGGYLTAWLTTQTHRFAGAIVERGFLDPVSFVGSSDIGWFFGLEYLGDAATPEGAAAVAAQSPMAHVGDVRTPTLVIHSEQDWRCPVEQGQRWFVELKRRGVPVELLLFPGEGHELSRSGRPSHRLLRFEHVLRWWATRLA
ncbi:S9 family peptidase [Actinotalea fermentans]|uniref:Dipeptidyl aminopeptidase n=1 Tax=Actinotalea fermentans TaxID=43671 RepID=A0A511YX81_9CELL|nr:S9 family peptidase [Actinotalea fermentans]GEN79789.1 dipeptidyl aminopeptidase [Actinotalea fermentans]